MKKVLWYDYMMTYTYTKDCIIVREIKELLNKESDFEIELFHYINPFQDEKSEKYISDSTTDRIYCRDTPKYLKRAIARHNPAVLLIHPGWIFQKHLGELHEKYPEMHIGLLVKGGECPDMSIYNELEVLPADNAEKQLEYILKVLKNE